MFSQRGGTRETGLPTTRRRSAGTRKVISSIRPLTTFRSGFFSMNITSVITERRRGSVSTPHMTASNTPMRLSILVGIAHLLREI